MEARERGDASVTAWGTGSPTREFLYVDDAAEGIALAMERYDKPDPVNLGSGDETSIRDLTSTIREMVGFEGRVEWDESKPDGQPRRTARHVTRTGGVRLRRVDAVRRRAARDDRLVRGEPRPAGPMTARKQRYKRALRPRRHCRHPPRAGFHSGSCCGSASPSPSGSKTGDPSSSGSAGLGKDGKEFVFLKFRTMVQDAESAGLVTADADPRVTRVGRVLRRTALDELPQVINVLRGDMSFVGPRALPVQMHLDAVAEEPRFDRRTAVMPGMTGTAQLYLPRHCSPRRRLAYDMLYVKRASLWLDVALMLRAAWNTLTGSWGTGHRRPEAPAGRDAEV